MVGWFFLTRKKKLDSTGFEPTASPTPAKRLIHLSYENIYIDSVINLLFICAITRAFPSEPPNVNPDSGTPPRVFYRPVLVLVSFGRSGKRQICGQRRLQKTAVRRDHHRLLISCFGRGGGETARQWTVDGRARSQFCRSSCKARRRSRCRH